MLHKWAVAVMKRGNSWAAVDFGSSGKCSRMRKRRRQLLVASSEHVDARSVCSRRHINIIGSKKDLAPTELWISEIG